MNRGRFPGVGVAPPLWVNGKPYSTNPRKGCTASIRALRPEAFLVLAGMQVNESHPSPSPGLRGRGLLSTSRAFSSLLSSVHEAVNQIYRMGATITLESLGCMPRGP
ncbi:hypothetical protein BHE74_00000391 [Ensete ventricosum]|uniref:Uncharacterized protein n=1 Tax=Ensete ventricosum TaxID=4639 RepID=A0A426Z456_ENSVE|nr:hypothetical protein B296_00001195 [Ensete ventricosum]RWW90535.1 hypothetical protein BHE74_00000391 [Ensete ventricosum]RZR84323.1 hypothetical protein BHM03_00011120 [Ensete ventricosum]